MIRKFATLVTAAIAVVFAFSVAGAAAAVTAAPVKAYGVCVNKVKKTWRPLEPGNLAKSRYGNCAKGESKILVPSVDGVPKAINGKSAYQIWLAQTGNAGKTEAQFLASLKGADGKDTSMPAKVQFKFGADVAVCTKGADTAAGIPAYDCVKP